MARSLLDRGARRRDGGLRPGAVEGGAVKLSEAYFCVGCEEISPAATLKRGNACPTCESRAIVPLTLWIKPIREDERDAVTT